MTSQAEQGERLWSLPRLSETDMPENLVCGPFGAPLAPMLCWLPVWKLFLRTASVKALQRNGFSPPHKITFKGAAAQWLLPRATRQMHLKSSSSESADHSGTNYGPTPESETHHFPKVGPRAEQTFRCSSATLLTSARFSDRPPRRPQPLNVGLEAMAQGTASGPFTPPSPTLSIPPTRAKYLLDLICISFSEMHLSLGLNKLSGRNRKGIDFRRYRIIAQ